MGEGSVERDELSGTLGGNDPFGLYLGLVSSTSSKTFVARSTKLKKAQRIQVQLGAGGMTI